MVSGFSARRCPRCNGNIFFERNDSVSPEERPREWYGWCLQCGYTLYLRADTVLKEESEVLIEVKK